MLDPLVVLDVESVGFHGQAFAWGAVLVNGGEIIDEQLWWCSPDYAIGPPAARTWVADRCLPALATATGVPNCESPWEVRQEFWKFWSPLADDGTTLAVDVGWPVEAGFLTACVADDPDARYFAGPYPLFDIGSLRVAGLIGVTVDCHDPLKDARESWFSLKPWWERQQA